MRLYLTRRRHRGIHRAGSPLRPYAIPRDPWQGQPLFDPALERQRAAARFVTCGRAL
jgi:hypothetical protein